MLLAACDDGESPAGSPRAAGGADAGGSDGLGGEQGSVSGTSGSGGASGGGNASGEGGSPAGAAGRVAGSAGEDGDSGESGAGGEAGESGAAGTGEGGKRSYPELLSQTGLYADIAADRLAPGVRAYRPAYELWADGATKRRFVKLPDGERIDSSDPDYLVYPAGTQLWKEFSKEDKRIETRMLEKTRSGWIMISYLWNEDLTDAVAVPRGERNARGTTHDVPDETMCVSCHAEMPDRVLGFTLLQLAHEEDAEASVTLATLVDEERLTDPPDADVTLPGDPTTRSALGYLHANCGHCHHERSPIFERTPIELLLGVRELDTLEETSVFRSTVGVEPMFDDPEASAIITPNDPSDSALYLRMQERGTESQMPPIATTEPDEDGLSAVRTFIESLKD